jgi:hypothetical protein
LLTQRSTWIVAVNPPKKSQPVERRRWRVLPLGRPIDAAPPGPPPAESAGPRLPAEVPESGWQVSSHDLLDGLEVTENPDSLRGDAFDRMFKR